MTVVDGVCGNLGQWVNGVALDGIYCVDCSLGLRLDPDFEFRGAVKTSAVNGSIADAEGGGECLASDWADRVGGV